MNGVNAFYEIMLQVYAFNCFLRITHLFKALTDFILNSFKFSFLASVFPLFIYPWVSLTFYLFIRLRI